MLTRNQNAKINASINSSTISIEKTSRLSVDAECAYERYLEAMVDHNYDLAASIYPEQDSEDLPF